MFSSSSSDDDNPRQHQPAERAAQRAPFSSPPAAPRPSISPSRHAADATAEAHPRTPASIRSDGSGKPRMSLDEYLGQLAGSVSRRPSLGEQQPEQPKQTPSSTPASRLSFAGSSDAKSRFVQLHDQSEEGDDGHEEEHQHQRRRGKDSSPLRQRRVVQEYESSEDDEWLKSLGSRVFKESHRHRERRQRDDDDDAEKELIQVARRRPRGSASRKEASRHSSSSSSSSTSAAADAGKKRRLASPGKTRATRPRNGDWSEGIDLLSSEDERHETARKAPKLEEREPSKLEDSEDEEENEEPYPTFSFAETSENKRLNLGPAHGRSGYIPAAIARYLRPYQIKGVQWIWKRYALADTTGAILGDEMGLGKTVQVIVFLAAVLGKHGNNADKKRVRARRRGLAPTADTTHAILIVCPSSVLAQWHTHLQQWGHFSVGTLQGGSDDKADVLHQAKHGRLEIVLMSYDMMRRFDVALRDVHWHVAVFDEFHVLKNPKSAATTCARMLSVDFRLGLTGTPIQNNLEELWCLLNVLAPRKFADKKQWKDHFSNPIKRAQKRSAAEEAVARGRQRQQELQRLLNTYMLRRSKAVIEHELKGKDDIIVFCALSDLQKTIYRRLLSLPDFHNARYYRRFKRCGCRPQPCKHKLPMLPDGSGLDERAVLWLRTHDNHKQGCSRCPTCVIFSCLAVLQKVANHPFLLQVDELDPNPEKRAFIQEFAEKALGPEILATMGGPLRSQRFTELTRVDISGKMETLSKLLERFHSKGDKVLLFSCSTQMLDLLQAFMKSKGYSHLRLDGRTPTSKRQQLIDEFNSSPGVFVFLISTRAGGLGLNLTAANKVIVFDVNWNPSYDMQAQDRAFRIGQQRHVQVFRLVAQGTVEELCYMRQVYKLQLTQAAMSKDARATTPRHFEGVEGEEHGELFGIENLLQFMDGSILKAIRAAAAPAATPMLAGDSIESQADIRALMRDVVQQALNDVKAASASPEEMDASQSADVLEDPSALLAALGVVGSNMAADEMLHAGHAQQSLDVLTHESDDELPSPEASPKPTARPLGFAVATKQSPAPSARPRAEDKEVELLEEARENDLPPPSATVLNPAARKRKLADVFVRGVRKHPPPAPAKKKAVTKGKAAAAKAKPKAARPVGLYVPDYLRKEDT